LCLEPGFSSGRSNHLMNLQTSYTILRTDDLAAAERWYAKLLGRRPDNRPMKTLVQWNLSAQHGVGLSSDELICGNGSAMFLIVDDLAAERRRLQDLGIILGENIPGDYSTLAQVRDPDGNLLTLATPPSPPYPPA
jgi:predicted enzyme related to lactoylglutathione lyase